MSEQPITEAALVLVDPDETREARLKRMKIRSWRRGTKEMDLILTAYADASLAAMSDADLSLYDSLLHENDQDLYQWVTGQSAPPARYGPLVAEISQALQK